MSLMTTPDAAPPSPPHMSPEQFRQHGHALIDWIADYLEHVEQHPVMAPVAPNDIRAALPARPPEFGEPFDQMMRDVESIIIPGITHWQSPNFFAFFPANTSEPAILGELLSAGLGVQGMIWATSPACTELEAHVLDWLVHMLDLPKQFHSTSKGGGVIQDTASSASLCALLAARERATNFRTNEHGTNGALTAYASSQAHSSIEKATKIAGFGRSNLRLVDVDAAFAMQPEALARAIQQDQADGRTPCFVCATVGTTSSNAIDPVRKIGEICREHGIWLHVDAASAGSAAVCPEFRFIHHGLELADSYCFNPHKWMLTNFDCDCFYVADRAALINTLSILPDYLKNKATASGAVIDYRDWQIPLGRRFRALKLWFVIRHYGVEGIRAFLRRHVAWAKQFAAWVRDDERFELVAEPALNLVCFRHRGGDDVNQQLMDRLNAGGKLYLSHTRLNGQLTLRFAIGGTRTRFEHVERAWRVIAEADPS